MNDFNWLLKKEIPRLRRYARALTHDVFRADGPPFPTATHSRRWPVIA
jgi:hypothetical protein